MKRYFIASFLLLSFTMLIFSSGTLLAQDAAVAPVVETVASGERLIEPVVQVGHSKGVQYVAFTPDARYIVSDDGVVMILWDAQTGKKLRACPGFASALSPDGKKFFAAGGQQNPVVTNLANGAILATCKAANEIIMSAAFDPTSQFLATGNLPQNGIGASTINIWDVATNKMVCTMTGRTPGVIRLAFAPQGDLLAAGDQQEGTVTLWNWNTGEKVFEHPAHKSGSMVYCVAFSPDGAELASSGGDGKTVFLDVKTKKITKRLDDAYAKLIYSPDGTQIIATDSDKVIFYDAQTKKKLNELSTEHTGSVNAIAFSPDGKFFLTGSDDQTVILWDAQTWKPLRQLGKYKNDTSSSFSVDRSLSVCEEKAQLAIGEHSGAVNLWDLNIGRLVSTLSAGTETSLVLRFNSDGTLLWDLKPTKHLGVWDVRTRTLLKQVPTDSFSLVLSPDGTKQLLFTDVWGGFLGAQKLKLEIRDEDGEPTRLKQEITLPQKTFRENVVWESDEKVIITCVSESEERQVFRWNLKTNKVKPDSPVKIEVPAGGVPTIIDLKLPNGESKGIFPYFYSSNSYIAQNGIVFQTLEDGTTRLFDKKTGNEICSLYCFGGGKDWLVLTPDGLFDGTAGARNMVSYRLGKGLNVQPVEAFFQDFYCPGLLAALWKGERPVPSATIKDQLPPEIAFVSPQNDSTMQTNEAMLEVLITDQGGGIAEPSMMINGVGYFVAEKPTHTGKTLRWKFPLRLADGVNSIVINSATADGQIACVSQPLQLTWQKKVIEKPTSSTTSSSPAPTLSQSLSAIVDSPSLHVLTIGISDYADGSTRDLPCAKADAEVLAEVLQRRGIEFYGKDKVHVTTLVDAQATSAGISKALKTIADRAYTEDVFLLLLAGHGVTIGKRYFFIPQDFPWSAKNEDFAETVRKHGLADDELQDWTNKIHARKRVVIYDTCQSGAAITRSGMQQRIAMEAFRKATGAFSVSAADGDQAAYELPEVGHGALTYALLAGLGEAKQGILKNRSASSSGGFINVRDWLSFAQDQVPILTQASFGVEQPVTFLSGETNFPIISVKP